MSENATGDFTVDSVQAEVINGPEQQQLPIDLSPEDSVRSNPAWDGLLSRVPSGLHPMITPELAKWDKNFQEVQTKFSPYKPYVDNNITAEQINQSLGLMQLALQNPRALYDQMVQQFGEEWGLNAPVQGQQEDNNPYDLSDAPDQPQQMDIENHPYVQQLKQNLDIVAQYLASQEESKNQAKYDQELDEQITTLQQSKGSFDEQTVLSYAAQGMSLEDAVDLYHQKFGQQQQSRHGYRPSIMPTGGGIPSQQVDVTGLSPKDTRGLVAHLIEQINGNS